MASKQTRPVEAIPCYAKLRPTLQKELIERVHAGEDKTLLKNEFGLPRQSIEKIIEEEVSMPFVRPAAETKCDRCGHRIVTNYCLACYVETGDIHGEVPEKYLPQKKKRTRYAKEERAKLIACVKKYRSQGLPHTEVASRLGISLSTAVFWANYQ